MAIDEVEITMSEESVQSLETVSPREGEGSTGIEWSGRLVLIFSLFFASGLAGLIYQVVWSRLLTLVVGVGIFAVTAVVCTYMAGLALGSYVIGRYGERYGDPLRVYGVLEAAIGIYAALTPWIFGHQPCLCLGLSVLRRRCAQRRAHRPVRSGLAVADRTDGRHAAAARARSNGRRRRRRAECRPSLLDQHLRRGAGCSPSAELGHSGVLS